MISSIALARAPWHASRISDPPYGGSGMRFCEIVRTNPIRRATACAVLMFLTAVPSAAAASIYVDFGAFNGAPSSAFGAAAGVAGVWNNITLLGATAGLLDTDGTLTSVGITVSATSMDGTGGPGSTDAARLMHDNFFAANGGAWSVSLSGLADGSYDLYLYDPTNRAVSTGGGTANGIAFASVNGAFSGSFAAGVDYLLLNNILVTGGSLTASGTEPGGNSGLAGLQLVARDVAPTTVPEPEIATLLACGLLMLWGLKHRVPQSAG
jgi:hypothetical protein